VSTVDVISQRDRLPSAMSDDDIDIDDDIDHDHDIVQDIDNMNINVKAPTTTKSTTRDTAAGVEGVITNAVPAVAAVLVETQEKPDEPEQEEEVTSLYEKQSLLVLAAEHDRVDILQAILSSASGAANANTNAAKNRGSAAAATADEKAFLLNPVIQVPQPATPDSDNNNNNISSSSSITTIPPLHIAVSYGSVNAVNCLLRMGADPSLRPNVAAILERTTTMAKAAKNPAKNDDDSNDDDDNEDDEPAMVEIPHIHRFDGITAWELAFAETAKEQRNRNNNGSWSLFKSSSSNLDVSQQSTSSTTSSPNAAAAAAAAAGNGPVQARGHSARLLRRSAPLHWFRRSRSPAATAAGRHAGRHDLDCQQDAGRVVPRLGRCPLSRCHSATYRGGGRAATASCWVDHQCNNNNKNE
jgi:hypothetical protein